MIYFNSYDFTTLRTQIRLTLTETPLISQTRKRGETYTAVLELMHKYLPFALALQQFVDKSALSSSSSESSPLTVFPPLFYGFDSCNLCKDRLIGREQRIQYCLPVELALLYFVMAQLHAVLAESQVDQGLRSRNYEELQIAERSWHKAQGYFNKSKSCCINTLANIVAGDPFMGSALRFFNTVIHMVDIFDQMCSIHRISTHISSTILVEDRNERLARVTSACARSAYTITRQAIALFPQFQDSELSRQLAWLLKAYEVRWKAIYYSCEQTIFQLDCQSDIALYFCEHILKCRIAIPPPCSQRHSAYFTRIAQELQLAHQIHLTSAMDSKKLLLQSHQQKFGVDWCLEAFSESRDNPLLAVQTVGWILNNGEETIDCAENDLADVETQDATYELVHAIEENVQRMHVRGLAECLSMSSNSNDATKDSTRHESDTILTTSSHCLRPSVDVNPASTRYMNISMTIEDGASNQEHSIQTKQTETLNKHLTSTQLSVTQQDMSWATMHVGRKAVHFEKTVSSAQFSTTPKITDTYMRRRNAVPMAIKDDSIQQSRSTGKPRPASSPGYLSTKPTSERTSTAHSSTNVQHNNNKQMWVPTRAQCGLCERRLMRQDLPGVVLMKRIFDLRRKWGMIIHDSKKFSAASALYSKASVCLMCQEILLHDDEQSLQSYKEHNGQEQSRTEHAMKEPDEVGIMIHNSILYKWHQEPQQTEQLLLLDVAVTKRARQSSTVFSMSAPSAVQPKAIRCAHTKEEFQPWWEVDLANYYVIHSVKIYLRDEVSHLYNSSNNGTASETTRSKQRSIQLQHNGVYPLHITISMKTGVGRDFDDIIASCVSSHCVIEKVAQPIVWTPPPNSRGRFVRIQPENVAILHIEQVQVFIAQPAPSTEAKMRREMVRHQLKRAAFRASVIAMPLSTNVDGVVATGKVEKMMHMGRGPDSSGGSKKCSPTHSSTKHASAFLEPDKAQKRRTSRLYERFKSLLDARSAYLPEDDEGQTSPS